MNIKDFEVVEKWVSESGFDGADSNVGYFLGYVLVPKSYGPCGDDGNPVDCG